MVSHRNCNCSLAVRPLHWLPRPSYPGPRSAHRDVSRLLATRDKPASRPDRAQPARAELSGDRGPFCPQPGEHEEPCCLGAANHGAEVGPGLKSPVRGSWT